MVPKESRKAELGNDQIESLLPSSRSVTSVKEVTPLETVKDIKQ